MGIARDRKGRQSPFVLCRIIGQAAGLFLRTRAGLSVISSPIDGGVPMVHCAPFRLIAALLVMAAAAGTSTGAAAQGMPSPFVQEVLIKSILVTLSDAVASDNFTVMHAKISKPFREQFPPEKLRNVFKDLIEKHAVFDAVVAKPIVPDAEAKIDENGVLRLKGHFETTPKQVKYQLGFIASDGLWKLSGITIDIE
jgi:hypothetical protein